MEMEIDFQEYQLSSELHGHEDDVRGICICGDTGFATSSRDKTVRFWSIDNNNNNNYKLSKILLGHTSFVGPLSWIKPNDEFLEGGIVSGGMDTLVLIWDLRSGESVNKLEGHKLQVTGLVVEDNADVISTSVDCTIRRWRNGQQVDLWEAHKAAIQAVLELPSNEIITGSSDTTLKLWKGKTCVHTFVGHTDTVRGLAPMPGLGVLSASHDGRTNSKSGLSNGDENDGYRNLSGGIVIGCCSVRLWALTGQVLMEMVGHTSIVYSVHAHVSGLIVSGSEDRLAKIWKDGVCVQSIEHPGCVWDAKFLDNGDIVTACSDGVVRIWTPCKDRIADPDAIKSYASRISEYKCSRKRIGGLKLEDLPGLETLHTPGTTDGQTKIVREGDNGVAYSWNSSEQKWDKIGEVVDGPEDNMKSPVLDGVQYDYVFDVDIGDGEPVRKLPYNRSDNPYNVADKWLLKENLPLSYREQVVEFILQNSGQKNFSLDTSFRDPYTGSNAYVPGEPSRSSGGPTKPVFKHIPKKGMLLFDVAQFDGILKKIKEFNSALLADAKDSALTEPEMSRLEAVVKILKDTSHYHISTFADVDIALLLKLLISWPDAMIFPVIDVLRMTILHPNGASLLFKHLKDGNDIVMETIKKVTTAPAGVANLLTTIRAVTNLFKHSFFHEWLRRHRIEILDAFSSCSTSNKNVQVSYSTLVLNFAVLLIENGDEEGQSQVLSAALEVCVFFCYLFAKEKIEKPVKCHVSGIASLPSGQIAEEESQGADAKFRALVAVGSLMLDGLMKKIAMDFDVQSVARVAKTSKDAKIAEVGADIELLTR
ncbi:hypothetical protein IFM89_010981 [Coptis chinensis]|uniref:Phospholipase A-2-activating protein n=1 Tax=Coptis chinensis TaxID=261450 RepID=A0A835MDY5_9MAGN|nr:hypothetical protein IFM89_010981 [Coptis chinensis]